MGSDKKSRSNAAKKGCNPLKAAQRQSAQAWGKKKKVVRLSDIAPETGALILSYLTKAPGQPSYVDPATKKLHHLNTVCKQWYLWLELPRTRATSQAGGYASLQELVDRKILSSPWKGPRSHPATPGVSPALASGEDGVKPTALLLTELAHPVPPSKNSSFSASTAAPKYEETQQAALAAVQRYADVTGSRAAVTHALARCLKLYRSRLGGKTLQQHLPAEEFKRWRVEAGKIAEVVKQACREGLADVSVQDANGRTLAHHACMYHDLPLVKILVQLNANVSAADRRGQNVLHYAAALGSLEVAQALLSRNDAAVAPLLHKRDTSRSTPLEIAARQNHSLLTMAISKRQKSLLDKPQPRDPTQDDDTGSAPDSALEKAPSEALTNSSCEMASSANSSPSDSPVIHNAAAPGKQQQGKKAAAAANGCNGNNSSSSSSNNKKKQQHFDACEERALMYAFAHDY